MRVFAFLLLLCAAGCELRPSITGSGVEKGPPRNKITSIIDRGEHAIIVTTGGPYRLDLRDAAALNGPLEDRVRELSLRDNWVLGDPRRDTRRRRALRVGDCEFIPSRRGLRARCAENDELLAFGGFSVTAVAEYRGRIYVATQGGGLRTLDDPHRPLKDFPKVVRILQATRQVLLCGTDDGLYAYNGNRTAVLRLGGATKLRFATLSS